MFYEKIKIKNKIKFKLHSKKYNLIFKLNKQQPIF